MAADATRPRVGAQPTRRACPQGRGWMVETFVFFGERREPPVNGTEALGQRYLPPFADTRISTWFPQRNRRTPESHGLTTPIEARSSDAPKAPYPRSRGCQNPSSPRRLPYVVRRRNRLVSPVGDATIPDVRPLIAAPFPPINGSFGVGPSSHGVRTLSISLDRRRGHREDALGFTDPARKHSGYPTAARRNR